MAITLGGLAKPGSRTRPVLLWVTLSLVALSWLWYDGTVDAGYDRAKALLAKAAEKFDDQQEHFRWHGWSSIEHLFAFGDSYTESRFDINGNQPTDFEPWGNYQSCREPEDYPACLPPRKWAQLLMTQYNHSIVKLYNMAVGGATTDVDIVPPSWGPATPFNDQVKLKFYRNYVPPREYAPWRGNNTLVASCFGINDLMNTVEHGKDPPTDALRDSYRNSYYKMYEAGVRNFLLLNVPPFDRTEIFDVESSTKVKAAKQRRVASEIYKYNWMLAKMAESMRKDYKGITIFYFDVNGVFLDALADPSTFPQTAKIKYIESLRKECAEADDAHPPDPRLECEAYFWGGLHPTEAVQQATAAKIVEDCFSGPVPTGYCSWRGLPRLHPPTKLTIDPEPEDPPPDLGGGYGNVAAPPAPDPFKAPPEPPKDTAELLKHAAELLKDAADPPKDAEEPPKDALDAPARAPTHSSPAPPNKPGAPLDKHVPDGAPAGPKVPRGFKFWR